MKKITLLSVILLFTVQFSFSQTFAPKRVSITNPNQSQLLKIKESGIDFTCGGKFVNNNLELELSYQEIQLLDNLNISYNVVIDDLKEFYRERNLRELPKAKQELDRLKLQSLSQKTQSVKDLLVKNPAQYDECDEISWAVPQNYTLGSMGGALTLDETLAQLDLMRSLYPNLISVKTDASTSGTVTHGNNTGSTTWSGQTLYYVRISDNPDIDEPNEPETLITGSMHAREVSSLMNTVYFMWYILENYNKDPFIKNLIDNHEIYVMPCANPDGYRWNEVIAPDGGGLQRKNLRPGVADNGTTNTNNNVRGVDLNRNFNYYWGWDNAGSSPTTSSNTYRGPTAGSEPETEIVQEFIAAHDIKVAVNHHGGLNSIVTSSYNGNVSATDSGREDEYAKLCHDLTQYNRYIYASAPNSLYEANGDVNDWMLGGPSVSSGGQTSSGSGKDVLALTPENGDDFWPTPTLITEIAQRAMRMNLIAVMHSGKFAKLHDLNSSSISSTSGNLEFGIEYLGKTYGDVTLTVTPISSNITSLTSPLTQTTWSKLEQRNLSVPYVLNGSIQPNDEIEFQVTLSNDDFVLYQANFVKHYQPTVLFQDNPDVTGIGNWTSSGTGTWGTTTDAYSGSLAITDSPSGSYSNSEEKYLTLNSSVDLSSSTAALVQFYAKWDLERNYDLVQIEARSNNAGTGWVALCGRYNKPAATALTNFHLNKNSTAFRDHQSNNGTTVYDGDSMDKWVMEEIYINDANNSAFIGQSDVQIRFKFKTDTTNREDDLTTTFDGFLFDDFQVISLGGTSISQTITFDDILFKYTSDSDFSPATASSGLPVTYSIISGPATIVGNQVSLTGATGTVVVQASQAGDANYSAATTVTTSFNVIQIACTGTEISSFPYSENFDSGIGDWTQGENDVPGTNYEDWTLTSGGTTSGQTGPTLDFTEENTGGAFTGSYFFTEASTANGSSNVGPGVTVTLVSPCINLAGYKDTMFSFYYHMFDNNSGDMGDLLLEVSTNNGNSWITVNTISGQQQTTQTSPWLQTTVDLSAYDGQTIKIRFAGATGGNYRSDMAIDEINLTANVDSVFTPIASCQNISVLLDGLGNATILPSDVDDGSSVGNLSLDVSSFTCSDLGTNNITLTATDPSDSGNTDTCVAVVTVTANKPADIVTNATICSGETYTWTAGNGNDY
ncbi:M14 family zinc carboxypeptidase, partial [Algibacter aquimarinus]|uniref:M14 family zinc carboxypeptidase n=1 Tax=Algibacter aquimarinus TaxID=1136748 RepID=UPI0031EFE5B9